MKQVNSTPLHGFKLIPLFLVAPWLGISTTTQVQAQPAVDTLGSPAAPAVAVPKTASKTVKPVASTPAAASTPGTGNASSGDASNTYIDRTDYSIGATQPGAPGSENYSQPSAVVLSERRTGRQTVLQPGQGITDSLFGSAPVSNRPATPTLRGISPVATQARSFPGSHPASPASHTGAGFSDTVSVVPGKIGPISLSKAIPPGTSGLKSFKPEKWLPDGAQLTFPLPIPVAITSAFGWRIHPITGAQRFHSGTDLGAPMGTPVLAAYKGKVAIANFLGGYGLTIVLEHQDARATRYAHLSQVLVQPGAWVDRGSMIGRVGSTGNSTGPHLHFELLQATPEGWIATDPSTPLESALAQLVQALQTAQARPRSGT